MDKFIIGLLGFFLGMLGIPIIAIIDEHARTKYKMWAHKKMQEANPPQQRNPIGFLKNNTNEQQH